MSFMMNNTSQNARRNSQPQVLPPKDPLGVLTEETKNSKLKALLSSLNKDTHPAQNQTPVAPVRNVPNPDEL